MPSAQSSNTVHVCQPMVLSISEQSADRNLPTECEPILRVEMDENAGTQTPTGVWSFKKTNGRLSFTEMYSQEGQEEISVLSSLPFLSSLSSLPFLLSERRSTSSRPSANPLPSTATTTQLLPEVMLARWPTKEVAVVNEGPIAT